MAKGEPWHLLTGRKERSRSPDLPTQGWRMLKILFNIERRNASYSVLSETHESKRTIRRIGPAMFDSDATLRPSEPRIAGQLA